MNLQLMGFWLMEREESWGELNGDVLGVRWFGDEDCLVGHVLIGWNYHAFPIDSEKRSTMLQVEF